MTPILLAAVSALVWGTGDYSGGKAARRASAQVVTVLAQLAGLPVLAVSVLVVGGSPTLSSLALGGVAGAAGFLGLVLLYRGLADGSVIVFAPISAVTAAVVPMIAGLLLGDRPGPAPLVGACCAILAIGLVSAGSPDEGGGGMRLRTVGMALASGALFGLFFILVGKAGPGTGMWPLVGARAASLAIGVAVLARSPVGRRLSRPSLRWALLAGPCDVLANILYRAAAGHGLLALVAPIGSLYPVSTVLLALVIDRERVRPAQLAGLGLAAAALVLVAT